MTFKKKVFYADISDLALKHMMVYIYLVQTLGVTSLLVFHLS